MSNRIDTFLYCQAVEERLRYIVTDKVSGQRADFCKLFYPLAIDAGKYAFEHYLEQIRHSEDSIQKRKLASSFSEKSEQMRGRINRFLQSSEEAKTKSVSLKKNIEIRESSLFERGQRLQEKIEARLYLIQANGTRVSSEDDRSFDSKSVSGASDNHPQSPLPLPNDLTATYDGRGEQTNWLENDKERLTSRLFWLDGEQHASRTILLASAGSGKSTLIMRLALYYCNIQTNDDDEHDLVDNTSFAEYYKLPSSRTKDNEYIPCLIRLRRVNNTNRPFEQLLMDSIYSFCPEYEPEEIANWLHSVESRLLLLIDGLDELSDDDRLSFLHSLSIYLADRAQTGVVLTSRASGLSVHGIKDSLVSMQFHGRAILPLSEKDIVAYCEKWINVLHSDSPEKKTTLIKLVGDIQVQHKYAFLREFMRKPLELTTILEQLLRSDLTMNKWMVFYEMLRDQFTRHTPYDERQAVFDDTLLFLSNIALYIQTKDTLFFRINDLSEMLELFKTLSFQTSEFTGLSTELIWQKLEALAANIGIVEKDDTNDIAAFTFPIRTYQEFLVAYACCHSSFVSTGKDYSASNYLSSRLGDTFWTAVAEFAILDMETNQSGETEAFKEVLCRTIDDPNTLTSIIENSVYINLSNAKILCEKFFSGRILLPEEKRLLFACIQSESRYSFRKALLTLYKAECKENCWPYLEALSYVIAAKNIVEGVDNLSYSWEMLSSTEEKKCNIGAGVLLLVSRVFMHEETPFVKEFANPDRIDKDETIEQILDERRNQETVDKQILVRLCKLAQQYESSLFITALSELWKSCLDGTEEVSTMLDVSMLGIMYSNLENQQRNGDGIFSSYESYLFWRTQFYSFAVFPVVVLIEGTKQSSVLEAYIDAMYEEACHDEKYRTDCVSLALAKLAYNHSMERFMTEWIWELCRGKPSSLVRMERSSKREKNTFALLRNVGMSIENQYRKLTSSRFNTLDNKQNKENSIALAIVDSAVEYYCSAGYGTREDHLITSMYSQLSSGFNSTTATNLAFLIRCGHIEAPVPHMDMANLLYELLKPGIEKRSPFSLINWYLFKLDSADRSEAYKLLDDIDQDGWRNIVLDWWYPQMWVKHRSIEGALVCLLGVQKGNINLPDKDEMISYLGSILQKEGSAAIETCDVLADYSID